MCEVRQCWFLYHLLHFGQGKGPYDKSKTTERQNHYRSRRGRLAWKLAHAPRSGNEKKTKTIKKKNLYWVLFEGVVLEMDLGVGFELLLPFEL
jgi:hypothetical protein